MKTCTVDILKESLEGKTKQWLDEYNDFHQTNHEYDTAIFSNATDIADLETFFDQKLEEIDPNLKGNVTIVHSLNPSTIKIVPDFNAYVALLAEGEVVPENRETVITDLMLERFKQDQDTLLVFISKAIENLKKLKDIKSIQTVIEDADSRRDIINAMNLLRSNIDKDLESKVSAFVSFMLSTKVQTDALVNMIQGLEEQGKFLKAKDIYKTALAHKNLFDELFDDFKGFPPSILKDVINSTKTNIDTIERYYLDTAQELVGDFLWDKEFNTDKYKAETQKLKDIIARFEKAKIDNPAQADFYDKRIEKFQQELDERVHNSQDIIDILLGKRGDIAFTESLFLSAERHPDIIISGLGKYYRKLMNEVNEKAHIPLANKFQNIFDKYLRGRKADGLGEVLNPELEGKKYSYIRTKTYVQDGVKKTIAIKEYKHGIDPAYYEELEDKQADVQVLAHQLRELSGDEYNKVKEEELKARQALYTFYEENSSRQYTKEYYQAEKDFTDRKIELLKRGIDLDSIYTPIQEKIDKLISSKRKVLGRFAPLSMQERSDLKSLQNEKFKLRSATYQFAELRKVLEANNISTTLTTEDIEVQYNNLKTQYESQFPEIFSDFDNRMEVANVLKVRQDDINDRHEYVLETEDYDGIEKWDDDISALKKEKALGNISDEEYEAIFNQLTDVRFTDPKGVDFQEAVSDVLARQEAIQKKIINLSGYKEKVKETFAKMRNIVRPYRLEGSIIQGELLTVEEQKAIVGLETESLDLREDIYEVMNPGGTLGPLRAEIKEKRSEVSALWRTYKQNKSEFSRAEALLVQQELNDLKADLEAEMDTFFQQNPELEVLFNEYQDIQEERRDLIAREQTDSYKAEFTKQLDIWVSKEHPLDVTTFKWHGRTYTLNDGRWSDGEKDVTESVFNIWAQSREGAFHKSEWFKNNHIYKEIWDKEEGAYIETAVPTYAWIKSVPNKDSNKGLTFYRRKIVGGVMMYEGIERPSFVYKKKVVRDTLQSDPTVSLKNDQSVDEMTGLPRALDHRRIGNDLKDYEQEYLDGIIEQYQMLQAKYPHGRRMGYRVPTIERKFNLAEANKEMLDPKNIWKNIVRSISTTAQDKDVGEGIDKTVLADTNLNKVQSLPHYFSTYLDVDLVSDNMFSAVLMYGYMANENEFKQRHIEGERLEGTAMEGVTPEELFLSTLDILEASGVTTGELDAKSVKEVSLLNRMGQSLLGLSPSQVKKKYGDNARLRILSDFVKIWFYGGNVAENTPSVTVAKHDVRLDKTLGRLRGMRSWTLLAAHPLQFFTWFKELGNMANSTFQSIILSLGKNGSIKFSLRQYKNAIKDYTFKYQKDLMRDYWDGQVGNKSYFGGMLDYFNVLEGRVVDIAGDPIFKRSIIKKLFSTDLLWVVKNGAELFNASTVFITYMKSNFLKHHGQDISYFDAFEQVGGEIKLKPGITSVNGGEVDVAEIRTDIQRILRITQGAYARLDQPLTARTWYGAGLIWMRQYFLEFMMIRFGKRQHNINEGRHVEGYWLQTVKSMKLVVSQDPRLWKIITGDNFAYNELTDEEKFNMKKSLVEVSMILTMYVITSIMFGYDEDDDDRFKKMNDNHDLVNWMLYSLMKAQSELESTSPIGGVDEMWRTAGNMHSSVFPFFADTIKIFQNDIEYWGVIPVGLERTKRKTYGYEKDTIKLYKDMVKLIGMNPNRGSAIEKIKGIEFSKQVR
jgi:hypothetical protein